MPDEIPGRHEKPVGERLPQAAHRLLAEELNERACQIYRDYSAQGMDRQTIASRLKMQPFVVGKVMPQARGFTREQILSCVEFCAEMEEAVKTGRLHERLAVELLIARQWQTEPQPLKQNR